MLEGRNRRARGSEAHCCLDLQSQLEASLGCIKTGMHVNEHSTQAGDVNHRHFLLVFGSSGCMSELMGAHVLVFPEVSFLSAEGSLLLSLHVTRPWKKLSLELLFSGGCMP